MSQFEDETRILAEGDGVFSGRLSAAWSIGTNPNGGYALTPLLRALCEVAQQPDPLSITTHFLRPGAGDADLQIHTEVVRAGRAVSTVRGTLTQEGKPRLTMLASFTDLSRSQGVDDSFSPPAPQLPPVPQCVHRSQLEQGVDVPLLSRADVYLRPENATANPDHEALIEGWVRLADDSPPTTFSLPFCMDAFPPSPIARLPNIGWVPTMELTIHIRRRPAPGWLRGRFHCDDLQGGRMIESGTLWDTTGAVVSRSRQVGLILARQD